MTLSKYFCYAKSLEEFITVCRNPAEGKPDNYTGNFTNSWIVANPFDKLYSNAMVKAATNDSFRIDGLIFVSNEEISAESIYTRPQLIATINQHDASTLMDFSYNASGQASVNASEPAYYTKMVHTFHQNCEFLRALAPFFMVLSIVFTMIMVAWCILCWKRKESTFSVQRLLTFMPAMMALQVLLQGLDYKTCPWVDADMAD